MGRRVLRVHFPLDDPERFRFMISMPLFSVFSPVRVLALLAPTLLFVPTDSEGQNVMVDENAFRIMIQGEMVGREEFSIRRVGMGRDARVILRATVEVDLPEGRRNLAPAMEASGANLAPTAYQLKVSGAQDSEIYVSRSGRRFLAKSLSPQGEQVREFQAGPGSVLLDEFVAHQHYLLVPYLDQESAVSVTVLSPQAGEQIGMTLRRVGEEEVRVGTDLVRGIHYRLEGGERSRDIWFDDQGRILRVVIPARNYVAERESMG